MKSKLKIAVASIAMAAITMATASADVRAEIEAAGQKYVDLLNSKDPERMTDLYTDDAVIMAPDEKLVKGRAAILERYKRVMPEIDWIETGITMDVIVQGDYATETGTWTDKSPSGETVADGAYIVVWKKIGTDWKVFRDTWTVISEAEPELSDELKFFKPALGMWEIDQVVDGGRITGTAMHSASAGGDVLEVNVEVQANGEPLYNWHGMHFWDADAERVEFAAAGNWGSAKGTTRVENGKIVIKAYDVEPDKSRAMVTTWVKANGDTMEIHEVILKNDKREEYTLNFTKVK